MSESKYGYPSKNNPSPGAVLGENAHSISGLKTGEPTGPTIQNYVINNLREVRELRQALLSIAKEMFGYVADVPEQKTATAESLIGCLEETSRELAGCRFFTASLMGQVGAE
jgi:hypothetical protein